MASAEQFMGGRAKYVQMQPEARPRGSPSTRSTYFSFHQQNFLEAECTRIFDELPEATIVQISRPDAADISPMMLTYTIEFQYKEDGALRFFVILLEICFVAKFWGFMRVQVAVNETSFASFYLHFALKKRKFIEEIHEKQEQVREWLQSLGIGDHAPVMPDDEEPDDEAVPSRNDEIAKNRDVPSSAALPIIRPALLRQHSMSDRARGAMQGYLNHFLSNIDIVNSEEVCKFLEVSKLSFSPEYGPKLKEDYIMPHGNGEGRFLAKEVNDHNPLRHYFRVTCGTRSIKLRTKSNAKVKDWVAAINDAGLRPPEGWCHSHRFGSFAPPRGLTADGSQAQWFVDGRAAFKAIALAIEEAKSEIFICGWWLCPELYLQRPFHAQASSRLDSLLESKAKQGVQVYILLYKEVALALKINSVHSKRKLLSIHENIRVLRYPDHFLRVSICGLDLCFGRYDYGEHKVGDHPAQIWPGKDYYNPRESEPNSWEDMMKDELDRKRYPRMPWHDVQCALWGPPCSDLARHFVQRWNYAKRNKAPNEQAIPLLLPQHHMVIPHYLGMNKEIEFGHMNNGSHTDIKRNDSFSSRASSQDIPLLMPQEAGGLDDVEGGTKLNGSNTLHDDDHPSRRYRSPFYFHKSRIEPLVPEMPLRDFADDLGTSDHQSEFSSNVMQLGMQVSEKDWWETQERGNQVLTADETGQVGPHVSCSCQVIRSVSQWSAGTSQIEESIHNAYCSLIERAEHYVYIENQFFISGLSGDELIHNRVLEALYRRIMRAHNEKKCFRVIIVIPLLPGFQGGVDDSGAASVRAIMHWQYRTICRGHNSILHNLYDLVGPRVHDYISFYGLRAYGRLFDGGPVATSQVYVHSKIMIIDDRMTLMGSANINDRSLLGSRDSEIGVLIEDKEYVNSLMGGSYWRAGKFASSLRISLWSEHLGLHAGEVNQIRDPVIDSTYKDIWMATAKTNTMIYQDVFSCIPNDLIHTRAALRQGMSFWREKVGQTTIDLGIAPKKLETYVNGDVKDTDPMERLECVKGHLVSYPLEFMCKEDLRPVFNESEYYASPQVFH
ncbi:UNVERIFIED_CONTAM: Phospholipase D zeta 1 [Sesamum angustifolium]|uniref:Phospholipase n=1 Tax=Sesamum angustifolium TaxID=2727405 RepID=A0AAW2NXI3_9LAMI